MKPKTVTLYNVIFPIWFLWILPMCWIFILPANLVIDSLVIVLTLKYLHCHDILSTLGAVILRVWLLGFAADLVGAGLLLLSVSLFSTQATAEIGAALIANPFSHPAALLVTVLSIAVVGVLIYWAARKFTLRRAALSEADCKKLALSLAIFTAPYTFLIPTLWH